MQKQHDTIATRLIIILTKLNQGERFTVDELVEEFNVTPRTIQRDLNNRLSYLPIKKEKGYYFLEEYYLGKLNFEDIKNFATLSGIKELYPNMQDSFITDILSKKVNQAYLIKGHNYEDLSGKTDDFKIVESSILNTTKITFNYKDKKRLVQPYKLVNSKGIWYLAGVEDDTLKTFSFSKIVQLLKTTTRFKIDADITKIIQNDDNVWFTKNQTEVILEVDKSVAEYFIRRKILPNQKIIEHKKDRLIVSTKVSFDEEILKIVRYWIPNVKIISPTNLQKKLETTLKRYLNI